MSLGSVYVLRYNTGFPFCRMSFHSFRSHCHKKLTRRDFGVDFEVLIFSPGETLVNRVELTNHVISLVSHNPVSNTVPGLAILSLSTKSLFPHVDEQSLPRTYPEKSNN